MSCISSYKCHHCGTQYFCNASKAQIEQGIISIGGPCCCGWICNRCPEGLKLREQFQKSSEFLRNNPGKPFYFFEPLLLPEYQI